MSKQVKFIKRESRRGYKIGNSYYSKENADLAVLETNIIFKNIDKGNTKNKRMGNVVSMVNA